jgi:hypothetical protein
MTAIGTIVPNNLSQNVEGDVACNKGMLGQTLAVLSAVNFSIDPSSPTIIGALGKYYHTYTVVTTGFGLLDCIITMQNTVTFRTGWRTRIVNISGTSLHVQNFLGSKIAYIRVGFTTEFILTNALANTWQVQYFIPKIPTPVTANTSITYDVDGHPQLTVLSSGIGISTGKFTAKTLLALKLNTGSYVTVPWDTQIGIDATYYTNNTITGVITVLIAGRYYIKSIIGTALVGGATISNFNARIRKNGTPINSFITSASLPTYTNNVFITTTVEQFNAGDTIEISCIKSPAGGGSVNTAIPNGCLVNISYVSI